MAKFIVKLNNDVIDHVVLTQGDMRIGRRPGCEIHLDNLSVSGEHANVFTIGDDSFVQDLKSTNGTYVNSKKVAKHHLKNGDQITVGKYSLTFVTDAVEEPVAYAKTVAITAPAAPEPRPQPAVRKTNASASTPGQATLVTLTGSSMGKRIELSKTVTNLGKAGKRAGAITRTADGYVLAGGDGEMPKLNGRPLSGKNTRLRNGDIIEVVGTRLQFQLK